MAYDDYIEVLDCDITDLVGTNLEPSYDPWDDIDAEIDGDSDD